MKFFLINQNKSERITRLIISVFLLPAPIVYGCNEFSIVQGVVGGVLAFNALSGMCVIYLFFRTNTCNI